MRIMAFFLFLFFQQAFSQEKFILYFDFAKDYPKDESLTDMDEWLKQYPSGIEIVEIKGYCDSTDTYLYNQKLANSRIQQVEKLLRKREAVFLENYKTVSFGKNFELLDRQELNRKVEVLYFPFSENKTEEVAENIVVANAKEPKKHVPVNKRFDDAEVGDYLIFEDITFHFNSDKIVETSMPVLKSVLSELTKNGNLKIEIHGHICCNPDTTDVKLSQKRARAVYQYLVKNGIDKKRLSYKGFGSSKPVYPIPEKFHQESVANRRVEILILEK